MLLLVILVTYVQKYMQKLTNSYSVESGLIHLKYTPVVLIQLFFSTVTLPSTVC